MSAISFPSSAFSLRLESLLAKPEGFTMHSKKRPEKALVLIFIRSIKQMLVTKMLVSMLLSTYHLFFKPVFLLPE